MDNLAGHDPRIIAISLVAGIVPSLIWLWFWLKEDKERPEPRGLILITFILGMAAVIFVLPLERFISEYVKGQNMLIFLLAMAEEVIKYIAVALVALRSSALNEPIDFPIFFIAAALGFAAFENTLFLLSPLSLNQTTVGIITGNLRFLGS